MDAYDIPAEAVSLSEETIKKSRFITLLAHTDGSGRCARRLCSR